MNDDRIQKQHRVREKKEDAERGTTERARGRGICGGWCCVKGSSTTPLRLSSLPLSGASPSSLLPPTPHFLLIRQMVTDKQMKIFDKKKTKQGHHTGTYWKHDP